MQLDKCLGVLYYCFCSNSSVYLCHFILAPLSFSKCCKCFRLTRKEECMSEKKEGPLQHLDWIAWVCLIIFTFDGELSQISSTRLRFWHGTFLNQAWKEIDWKENTIMGKQFILFSLTEGRLCLYCRINISWMIALTSWSLEESWWFWFI